MLELGELVGDAVASAYALTDNEILTASEKKCSSLLHEWTAYTAV